MTAARKLSPNIARKLDAYLSERAKTDSTAFELLAAIAPRRKTKKHLPFAGRSKAERDAERDGAWSDAKMEAAIRAGAEFTEDGEMVTPPQCEERTNGVRCTMEGVDPDHVLGGAYRKDCERLGAKGLMVRCRGHHEQKHANLPTRAYQLAQAKEHAIRIGSRDLLRLVEQAVARDEMRHVNRRAS